MSYSGQGTPWDGGPPGAEADYANHTSQMYRPHQDLNTSQSIIWPDSVQSYGQYPTGYSYTDTYQSNSQYAAPPSSYIYGPTAPAYYPQQTTDHIPIYSKTYTESHYEQVSRPFDKTETNYLRPRRSRSRSPYESRYIPSHRNRPRQRSLSPSPDRRANRHTRSNKSPSNERFKSRERSDFNQSRDRSHSKSVVKKSSSRRSLSKSSSSSSSKSACSSRDSSSRSRKYRSPSNSSKRSNRSAKINKKPKSMTHSPSPCSGRFKTMRSRSGSSASSRNASSSEKKYKQVDKSYAYYNSSTSASNNDSDSSEVSDKSSESKKKRSPKRSSSPTVGKNYKNPIRSYSRNRDRSNSYDDYSHEKKASRTSIRRRTRSRERSSSASYSKRERTPRRRSSSYKDKVASVKDRPKRGEYSPESYRSRSPSHSRHFRGKERSKSISKRYRNLRSPSLSRQLKYREKSPSKSSYDSSKTYLTNKKTQPYPRKSHSSSPDEKKFARKTRSRSKSSVPVKNDNKILQSDNKMELDSDNSDTELKSPPLEESGFNFENLPPPDEKMFLKSKPDLRAELEKHLKMHNKANLHDQAITNTMSMPQFKNDGSFLEMFKKMQETAKTGESSQKKMEEVKAMVIKKPALPFIGKRRGGRVLKTGLVKKAKAIDEQLVDNAPKDAWSLYMQEVKKYRETSCEEERKTRPLVK